MSSSLNYFAQILGLPKHEYRAKIENVKVNDIITCKVDGKWIFCKVDGTTPTMIKVSDLQSDIENNAICLYLIQNKNPITNGLLNENRRIFFVENVRYCYE